jgi:hypothetical protein
MDTSYVQHDSLPSQTPPVPPTITTSPKSAEFYLQELNEGMAVEMVSSW